MYIVAKTCTQARLVLPLAETFVMHVTVLVPMRCTIYL